jgi:hypothetical protein
LGIKKGLHPNLEKFFGDQTKNPKGGSPFVYSQRKSIFLRGTAKDALKREVTELLCLSRSKTVCQGIEKSFTPRGAPVITIIGACIITIINVVAAVRIVIVTIVFNSCKSIYST